MFGKLFGSNPTKKLEKQYAAKMEEAMKIQRSGDLKKYAVLIEEAEAINKQLEEVRAKG